MSVHIFELHLVQHEHFLKQLENYHNTLIQSHESVTHNSTITVQLTQTGIIYILICPHARCVHWSSNRVVLCITSPFPHPQSFFTLSSWFSPTHSYAQVPIHKGYPSLELLGKNQGEFENRKHCRKNNMSHSLGAVPPNYTQKPTWKTVWECYLLEVFRKLAMNHESCVILIVRENPNLSNKSK